MAFGVRTGMTADWATSATLEQHRQDLDQKLPPVAAGNVSKPSPKTAARAKLPAHVEAFPATAGYPVRPDTVLPDEPGHLG